MDVRHARRFVVSSKGIAMCMLTKRNSVYVLLLMLFTNGTVALADDSTESRLAFPSAQETAREGVSLVTKFLDLMVKNGDQPLQNDSHMWSFISSEYLASQGVDTDKFLLDVLAIDDYRIIGTKNHYVNVEGIRKSHGWSRRMTFRLLKEDGKLVIEPSSVNRESKAASFPSTVTPWWTIGEVVKKTAK